MKVFHRGLFLVGIPFVLELALIASLMLLVMQSDREQVKESTYRKITGMSARSLALLSEIPYFLILSIQFQSDDFYKIFEKDRKEIRRLTEESSKLRVSAPELWDGTEALKQSQDRVLELVDAIAEAKNKGSMLDLISKMPAVRGEFDRAKVVAVAQMGELVRKGEERTKQMQESQAQIRNLQNAILILGLVGNALGAGLLAAFFKRSIMDRIHVIKDNTEKLSRREVLAEPLSGSDEIAALDCAFHLMDRELKEAAAREQDLFDNASDVICVLDFDYKFTKVNLASTRIWGYEPRLLTMMGLGNIVLPEDLRPTLEEIDKAKVTGKPIEFESRINTRSGNVLETLWSAYWSENEQALFCVVHDITERKNAERVKKQFLAMISFDLKRPLSSISAAVTLLVTTLAESMPKMAVDKLDMAKKNLKRLLGLVNDLLQLTEMESGNFEIHKENCDVEELLIRSVQDVEALAEKTGVKLQVESVTGQWFIDPNRIMQVLVNLLSNAIKFSPQNGVVTLSAHREGDLFVVKVIDQGRGVPDSHKDLIFEKFKQVEAADGKRKAGTGLGLPICKQIVEEHCGSIGVESEDGKGSSFWFSVPVDETVSMRMKAQALAAERDRTKAAEPKPLPVKRLPEQPHAKGLSGRLRLGAQGTILIGIPVLFELFVVGSMTAVLARVDSERAEELHQRNIAFLSSKIINGYFRATMTLVDGHTESDWRSFQQSIQLSKSAMSEMRSLMNRPQEMEIMEKLSDQADKIGRFFDRAERVMEPGFSTERLKEAFGGKDKMAPSLIGLCRKLQKLCVEVERKEFVSPERQRELRTSQSAILIGALVANIALCLAMAIFFSRNITSRLKILADNADRLAREKELNPQLSGTDEIAELDRVFHTTALAVSEARQKERAVFDNSQDVICAINARGVFTSLNPAAERLWGFTKEELVGTPMINIVAPEDRDAAAEQLAADFGNTRRHEFECRIAKKDGTPLWVLWSCSRSETGETFCIAHDITNRKELEQLKQEFLAMVSHDLRTPLTSILGIAKLIIAGAFGKVSDRPLEVLRGIIRNGDQLLELINDLLDIEKLEAGKMQLILENVKVREIIERSVASTHNAKRVAVDLLAPEGIEIVADRDRIIQAIANILNHALGHSPEESAVHISVSNDADFTVISVLDSAAPVPETARELLFDRFKTAAGKSCTEQDSETSGSGLGMPIARKIVESHGGTIGVMPRGESGNRFWIRIPGSKQAAPSSLN
ncbi:MAG: PAS domain S-box protein [Candidatus Obscuribacterales bacterium]|nr:PAS domain S-box protein [Candidatus Obscuribacterales bacterium]